MPWEIVIRDDAQEGKDSPLITVGPDYFLFNAMFCRLAELGPEKRVTFYLDHENYKIGFEFHEDDRDNSYGLTKASGGKTKSRRATQCWASKVTKFAWVRKVSELPSKERRFKPKKEGKLWVIQLCPAFERWTQRTSPDIPADATGIYRYLRSNGEVVYIGRGQITQRLASPERENWDFERIEYSVIPNQDRQAHWESYWLARFREENKGNLPIYNKIAGITVVE